MLTRMLGSTVYASSTVLASFMAGLALGSYLCGRVADRVRSPVRLYGLLELGIAGCGIALPWVFDGLLPTYRGLFAAIGDSPAVFLAVRAAIVFPLLMIPTALMGATLPALSACVGREAAGFEKRVAWLYRLNTLGAMLGALASGLVLLGLCGETWTILIAAAINIGVGLFAIKRRRYLETSHDNRTHKSGLQIGRLPGAEANRQPHSRRQSDDSCS